MPAKRGGASVSDVWPQATGATGMTGYESLGVGETPLAPRFINWGSGPQSRTGSWAPQPISQAPPINSPMQTGNTNFTGLPGSAAAFAGMASVRGQNTGTTGFNAPAFTGASGFTTGPQPGSSSGVRNTFTGQASSRGGAAGRNRRGGSAAAPPEAEPTPAQFDPPDAAIFPLPPPDPDVAFVGAPTKVGQNEGPPPDDPISAHDHDEHAEDVPLRPPISRTLKFAIEMSTPELQSARYRGKTLSDARIAESRGAALVDATRAFYGTHRPAYQRMIWNLPMEHDERVSSLMDWIDRLHWALAKFGMRKFLETKKRGALICNAGYISPYYPHEPVFDWYPFDRAQDTGDRILQESIAVYNPATTTILFVILASESYNSVALWRRQLTLPPSIQLSMSIPLEKLKKELRKTTNIIHVKSPAAWMGPTDGRRSSSSSSTPTSSRPTAKKPEIVKETIEVVPELKTKKKKKKKKIKWWQFWKRLKITWGDD